MDFDRFSKDDVVGSATINAQELLEMMRIARHQGINVQERTLALRRTEKNGVVKDIKGKNGETSTLTLNLTFTGHYGADAGREGGAENGRDGPEEGKQNSLPLSVRVMRGAHIPRMDGMLGTCDPYVMIEYGADKCQTLIKKGYNVTWDQEFELEPEMSGSDMQVKLYDMVSVPKERVLII